MMASEKIRKKKLYVNPIALNYPELYRSDVSIAPSYTHLRLAYDVVCRERYAAAEASHRNQFMKELLFIEQLQNKALDGVRVHREFSQGILSHKIPPQRYIMSSLTPNPFTLKQRMRLDAILN